MIEVTHTFLTGICDLPADKHNRPAAWLTVLDSILKAAAGKIRVVQWGTGYGLEQLLQSDKVEKVVACESDRERFESGRRVFATHLTSGKLTLHHFPFQPLRPQTSREGLGEYNPNHDFIMHPLRQLGEEAIDLAILQTDDFATDCAEIAQLLVKDEGIILWTGMTSWSDPLPDHPSDRMRQEVAANFVERYYLDQHQCLLIVNRKRVQENERFRAWAARRDCIAAMFRGLDEADVEFLLLSNPGNLSAIYGLKPPIDTLINRTDCQKNAPTNPAAIADIDVLATKTHFQKAKSCLQSCGLRAEPGNEGGAALYGGGQQQFFFSEQHVIRVHLFDSLQYASLDRVHRVCLHASLQQALIARRRYTYNPWLYTASINDSLLHNLCRCLFDKQGVPENYATLIDDLYSRADLPALRRDLEFVFFKFAGRLEQLLQAGQASALHREYIGFQNY